MSTYCGASLNGGGNLSLGRVGIVLARLGHARTLSNNVNGNLVY